MVVSSGSARAVILGDVLHCPLQVTRPGWGVVFDVDPDLARRTRERQLAELEGTDTLVGCSHFPEVADGCCPARAGAAGTSAERRHPRPGVRYPAST